MTTYIDTNGAIYHGKSFKGHIDLTGSGNRFEDCDFDGDWGLYCLSSRTGGRRNHFVNCRFHRAEKLVLAQNMRFDHCIFEEAGNDAIFVDGAGNVAITGKLDRKNKTSTSIIRDLGHSPGAHADGLQIPGWYGAPKPESPGSAGPTQRNIHIRGVYFDLPHAQAEASGRVGTNSCVFLESDFSPVDRVSLVGCVLDGGNYPVYALERYQIRWDTVRFEGNTILSYRFSSLATTRSSLSGAFSANNNFLMATQVPPKP